VHAETCRKESETEADAQGDVVKGERTPDFQAIQADKLAVV